jgi:hypothetical protein
MSEENENVESIIEQSIPENPVEVRKLVVNLTKELMEKSNKLKAVEKELKQAVKRKKAPYDPRLKRVAMVMFTKPKSGEGKIRMHTVDNVHGNMALMTVKRTMTDPDNHFIGAYLMLPMQGYPDAYGRMTANAEAVWHLFERLDQDLKKHDPERKEDEEQQAEG